MHQLYAFWGCGLSWDQSLMSGVGWVLGTTLNMVTRGTATSQLQQPSQTVYCRLRAEFRHLGLGLRLQTHEL